MTRYPVLLLATVGFGLLYLAATTALGSTPGATKVVSEATPPPA